MVVVADGAVVVARGLPDVDGAVEDVTDGEADGEVASSGSVELGAVVPEVGALVVADVVDVADVSDVVEVPDVPEVPDVSEAGVSGSRTTAGNSGKLGSGAPGGTVAAASCASTLTVSSCH